MLLEQPERIHSPMHIVIVWIAIAALVAALGGTSWVLHSFLDRFERLESTWTEALEEIDGTPVEDKLERLTIAVAEGIAHVDRAERRVATTLRSAHSKFAKSGFEHAGVEAEIENLPDLDGEGSEDGQLRLMPEDVEVSGPDNSPSGIPGMTVDQANQIRAARAAEA